MPSTLDIAAICLVITALLAYLNHRFIRLPTTIGVMAAALILSLALVGLDAMGLATGLHDYEEALLKSIDFSTLLMQGMLSLLLFAGALHVDLSALKAYRWPVAILAVAGTLLSTFAVGYGLWYALPLIGLKLPLMYCLLFGALISPTDPIAVMGILKSAGAPKELELVISGESLFNDGVGVVIFSLLLGMLASGHAPSFGDGVDMFWELIDEILNATLFVLIGMEVVLLPFSVNLLLTAAMAIAVTLAARWFTVGLPVLALRRSFRLPRGSSTVLTWGGLRGGISVALALSLPAGPERHTIVALTYCIVVFSILVQGLSIGAVTRRAVPCSARPASLP